MASTVIDLGVDAAQVLDNPIHPEIFIKVSTPLGLFSLKTMFHVSRCLLSQDNTEGLSPDKTRGRE